jgi:riboflavin synthase
LFTGIVSAVGTIMSAKPRDGVRRLRIASRYPARTIARGASIAVNGACLTVVAKGRSGRRDWFEVDVGVETLARTTAGDWSEGRRVNLERAMKAGDEFGGHLVTGHVDGVAEIRRRDSLQDMARLVVRAPSHLARFIAPKGSVTLDGISLTVNGVEDADFSVMLVPYTLSVTAWKDVAAGDRVNLEVDLIARYLARLAEASEAR